MASSDRPEQATEEYPPVADGATLAFRRNLNASMEWMLRGVEPPSSRIRKGSGRWAGYVSSRGHYREQSLVFKRNQVHEWMQRTRPCWVVDLGANTGEFSRIAAASGSSVVAVDQDHDAIDELYRSVRGKSTIHVLVSSLDDMCGGRGWCGSEHSGLPARLSAQFDMALMLALIHHIAVGASVPLSHVAAFAARTTRRWLIAEWIGEEDPQIKMLCAQRRRSVADFSIAAQRSAFARVGFRIEAEAQVPATHRVLALLSKES